MGMQSTNRWAIRPFLLTFFIINFTGMCYFLFDYRAVIYEERENDRLYAYSNPSASPESHSAILPNEAWNQMSGQGPFSPKSLPVRAFVGRGSKVYDYLYEYSDVVANPTDSYQYGEAATLTGIIRANKRRRKGPRWRASLTTPFILHQLMSNSTQVPPVNKVIKKPPNMDHQVAGRSTGQVNMASPSSTSAHKISSQRMANTQSQHKQDFNDSSLPFNSHEPDTKKESHLAQSTGIYPSGIKESLEAHASNLIGKGRPKPGASLDGVAEARDTEQLVPPPRGGSQAAGAKASSPDEPPREEKNPDHFQYLTINHDICSDETFLLIMVHSRFSDQDKRNVIRETWGSLTPTQPWFRNRSPEQVKFVYLLGDTNSIAQSNTVKEESAQYEDIVQGDFEDSSDSTAIKLTMGYTWASTYCTSAQFVMKTNDDTMLNIPKLLDLLWRKQELQNVIIGAVYDDEGPVKAPFTSSHLSGTAYVTSVDVLTSLMTMLAKDKRAVTKDSHGNDVLGVPDDDVTFIDGFMRPRPTACDIIMNKVYVGTGMDSEWNVRHIWSAITRHVYCKDIK